MEFAQQNSNCYHYCLNGPRDLLGDRLELLGEERARVRVEEERINPPPAPPNVPFL